MNLDGCIPNGNNTARKCNKKSWHTEFPIILFNDKFISFNSFLFSELDIMNLFQQKQTSLYKPVMELNQDTSSLKNHFSPIAITAARETFLKSSMLVVPQPKPLLSSEEAQKHPNPPERLWHDQITTQATVDKVGLDDTTTKLNYLEGANTFADLPVVNNPTISITTLLPVFFLNPTQTTILVTKNDQAEVSSKLPNQDLFTHKDSSTARMQHEISLQDPGVSTRMILPTVGSSATETPSPETLKHSDLSSTFKIPFEALTDEDISKSLQIKEEVYTAFSPTSLLDLPLSKNEPLTSKTSEGTSPPFIPGIRAGELLSTLAPGAEEDPPSWTERPTAHIPAMHSTPVDLYQKHLSKGSTVVRKDPLEPRRLSVGHLDEELFDISLSGNKIAHANANLQNTPIINNPDQDNATVKQSAMNQTSASTVRHSDTVTTPSISGFPEFHASKRRPVCPYPPLPAHGTFYFHTIPNPAPFQYKHYIQYACYAGYTLANGDVYSYCLQDGRWSGLTPVCIGKSLELHNSLCLRRKTDLMRV